MVLSMPPRSRFTKIVFTAPVKDVSEVTQPLEFRVFEMLANDEKCVQHRGHESASFFSGLPARTAFQIPHVRTSRHHIHRHPAPRTKRRRPAKPPSPCQLVDRLTTDGSKKGHNHWHLGNAWTTTRMAQEEMSRAIRERRPAPVNAGAVYRSDDPNHARIVSGQRNRRRDDSAPSRTSESAQARRPPGPGARIAPAAMRSKIEGAYLIQHREHLRSAPIACRQGLNWPLHCSQSSSLQKSLTLIPAARMSERSTPGFNSALPWTGTVNT